MCAQKSHLRVLLCVLSSRIAVLPFTCTYCLLIAHCDDTVSKYFGFFAPYTQTASSSLLHVVYELKREEMHLNDQLGVFVASWFWRLISVCVFCGCRHCFVLRCLLCCWCSGLGVLTVDAVSFSIHGTLAALTVDDTSPRLPRSLNFSVLPLLCLSHCHLFPSAPHTLHLSRHYDPFPCPFSLLFLPPFPHYRLPPPLPLAKVHVINQTELRLCLRLAVMISCI